ncbi:Nuclear pore complex component (sc Seh1) [Gloeomargarita lithophora Alchichica-D10]|uniref:Nuclear pore complex component (Sc Seh1) n=1 Tax=Gloeomargarita lithophora Alchichica-D10 TaxID=1188229 RepID=A0A1J0A962_9CYAN|nr:Nuclear pore complex component (sc Seh1) [Gloeomargarita lithophora Alchichica-D10]
MTESLLFGLSLFPYLGFLWCLGRAQAPAGICWGFGLTLLFVAITIPAGIAAQKFYGESLANVDGLHGGAELWLTVANLTLVLGARRALQRKIENQAAGE